MVSGFPGGEHHYIKYKIDTSRLKDDGSRQTFARLSSNDQIFFARILGLPTAFKDASAPKREPTPPPKQLVSAPPPPPSSPKEPPRALMPPKSTTVTPRSDASIQRDLSQSNRDLSLSSMKSFSEPSTSNPSKALVTYISPEVGGSLEEMIANAGPEMLKPRAQPAPPAPSAPPPPREEAVVVREIVREPTEEIVPTPEALEEAVEEAHPQKNEIQKESTAAEESEETREGEKGASSERAAAGRTSSGELVQQKGAPGQSHPAPAPPKQAPSPLKESSASQAAKQTGSSSPTATHLRSSAAHSPQGSWAFSNAEQRNALIKTALLMTLLFEKSSTQPPSLPGMQLLAILTKLDQMSKQLDAMRAQMQQLAGKGGNLSESQANAFRAALNPLLKQMEESKKALLEANPELQGEVEAGELSDDPLKAAAQLKEKASKLSEKTIELNRAKLEALTQRTSAREASEAASATKQPGSAAALPTTQTPPREIPPPPQLRPEIGMAKEMQAPPTSTAPSFPTSVRTPSDLHALSMAAAAKQAPIPLVVSLSYPFERRAETQITKSSAKATSEKKEEEKEGARGFASGKYKQPMCLVPKGPALIGDPFEEGDADELPLRIVEVDDFLISAHPITNNQFVDWLQAAFEEKKIELTSKGIVLDRFRNVICTTYPTSAFSQIQATVSKGVFSFDALKGAENNPVVEVSWYGAQAFCEEQGLRLPTEAEWEKAAGMQPSQGDAPLVKFRYGNGKNEIDPSQANYLQGIKPLTFNGSFSVGFFNGTTVYNRKEKQYATRDVRSPYGCYDMSGNVREWVSDGEKKKMAKGGSYNTTEKELRVSAHAFFNPDECLPDTSFRAALSL